MRPLAVSIASPMQCSLLRRCLVMLLLLGGTQAAEAAHRLALVIGNDSYQHAEVLRNARADARAVAASLQSLGFTVTLRQDLTLQQMKVALRAFKASVAGGDEVVFYFSGHGVQFGGTNYLIPVDLVPENEEQVADDAIGLQRVLDDLSEQKARFSLAIIDACRDNPFKGSGRAIGKRGLAPVQAATGQMVLYSAGAGQEALDRLGGSDSDPNGLFTRILIKEIKKPGVPANQLLKNVSYQVVQLAKGVNHDQVPALYDQTIGDYYFVPKGQVAAPLQPAAASADTIHVESAGELEQEFWNRIKDSTDPADFSDYTKQYPQGAHAAEAALTMRRLKRAAQQKTSAPALADAAAQPVTRTKSLPVSESSAAPVTAPAPASPPPAQASGSAVTPGSYGGYTTDYSIPGARVLGRLMLGDNGQFVYRTDTGATVRGTFDLSNTDNVTGRAVVTLGNGNSARMLIQGRIAGGKLLAQYKDEWGYSGDIVLDLSNPH
jgi:uncharacterized caspase-like protein